tara:strand:+ start:6766 stop:7008 length:243 start_codon:yes stop_codon:yes gene_type:complete
MEYPQKEKSQMNKFIPLHVESKIIGEKPREIFVPIGRIVQFESCEFGGCIVTLNSGKPESTELNVTEEASDLISLINESL